MKRVPRGRVNISMQLEARSTMSTIHFKKITTATPEQFIAGLTDFGPGRAKLFGNSTDQYLQVHKKGTNFADVTRGLGRYLGTTELQLV